jgi:virginiamycin B lyase
VAMSLILAGLGGGVLLAVELVRTDPAPSGSAGAPPAARPERSATVGQRPVAIRAEGDNLWVASTRTSRLGRVHPVHLTARGTAPRLGRGASGMAVRRGVLWVAVAKKRAIYPLDARTGRAAGKPVRLTGQPRAVSATRNALWVAEQSDRVGDHLTRIDPGTRRIVARIPVPDGVNDVRAGGGGVWVVGRHEPVLLRFDRARGTRATRMRIEGNPLRVDLARGYAWVTNHGDDSVARVDPRTGEVVTIGVPGKPYGIFARPDGVWVACYDDHTVVRIDPRTSRVTGPPIPVGLNPIGVYATEKAVWVTGAGDHTVTRVRVSPPPGPAA